MMGKAGGYGTFLRAYRNFPRRTTNSRTNNIKHMDNINVSHDPPVAIIDKDIPNEYDESVKEISQ